MDFSNTIKKKAGALGVKPEYMIMADLMAIGYNERDAFLIAYPDESIKSESTIANKIQNITLSERFKKLKTDTRKRLKENLKVKSDTSDNLDLISGEDVAREVLKSAIHQPTGSKERAELFIKYQELMRKNDVSDDVTEEPIQFYLPLCCDQCPLMIAHKNSRQ